MPTAVFADGEIAREYKVCTVGEFSAAPSDAPADLVDVACPRHTKVQSSIERFDANAPPSTHALHRSALLDLVSLNRQFLTTTFSLSFVHNAIALKTSKC